MLKKHLFTEKLSSRVPSTAYIATLNTGNENYVPLREASQECQWTKQQHYVRIVVHASLLRYKAQLYYQLYYRRAKLSRNPMKTSTAKQEV